MLYITLINIKPIAAGNKLIDRYAINLNYSERYKLRTILNHIVNLILSRIQINSKQI